MKKTHTVNMNPKSIRTFIGSNNFSISREFYLDLGFEEVIVLDKMSYFKMGEFGFYLQDAYVKGWIENSMVFMEVERPEDLLETIRGLDLPKKYKGYVGFNKNGMHGKHYVYDLKGKLCVTDEEKFRKVQEAYEQLQK